MIDSRVQGASPASRRLLLHIGLVLTAFDRSARARWVRWCLGPTSLFDRRADFYCPSVEAPFALPSDNPTTTTTPGAVPSEGRGQ